MIPQGPLCSVPNQLYEYVLPKRYTISGVIHVKSDSVSDACRDSPSASRLRAWRPPPEPATRRWRKPVWKQFGNFRVDNDDVRTLPEPFRVFPADQHAKLRAYVFGSQIWVIASYLSIIYRGTCRGEARTARSKAQLRMWLICSFIVRDKGTIVTATLTRSWPVTSRSASRALVRADTTHCSISAPAQPIVNSTSWLRSNPVTSTPRRLR